jgi:hypothetical protein
MPGVSGPAGSARTSPEWRRGYTAQNLGQVIGRRCYTPLPDKAGRLGEPPLPHGNEAQHLLSRMVGTSRRLVRWRGAYSTSVLVGTVGWQRIKFPQGLNSRPWEREFVQQHLSGKKVQ